MTRAAADIFHEARAMPAAQRAGYLQGVCGKDLALLAKVEALLKADAEAGNFMTAPTSDGAEPAGTTLLQEHPGVQIGRYMLLEQIGQGGMGTIWMAEQREPVKRRVALKIIKLGMDTKQVIARFEAERQALAMMDHPNIAKVLDAGATEMGRPYFVMEYIKGIPILEYCDQAKIDTKARLELFTTVCHAIQHAHQKGIIHRDIKPSNVLVTLHDGLAVPKVIDFGIAKATHSELTTKTLFTEHRQMLGTPAYMSPEQAEMSGLDIDTRSDIYSLGVLLYELLTGTTPFDMRELLSMGFAEMMRTIREVEPHKPSTRISTLGDTGTRTAQQRLVDPKRLGLLLRGDIDWIVMKCLEKDRSRRYETANGLAADIKRHLNDEPVTAGAPSAGYRLRKFVRRNRVQVIAASAVLLALLAGTAGTGWGVVAASRTRSMDLQRKLEDEQRAAADGARLARNAEFVTGLLGQGEEALRADDAAKATVALDAARKRSAEGGAEQDAERLERLAADLAVLVDLDAVDQLRWTWSGNRFAEPELVTLRTRQALARFGADPEATSVEDAAARVRQSVVGERIVSALDRRLRQTRSAEIRDLIRRVDADPYRDAVRDAVRAGDRATLVELADQNDALEQPSRFAAFLGETEQIPLERRWELLQAAVIRRSGDVDLLMALGTLSYHFPSEPRESLVERLRWFQAAVAADPENLAALNDLGGALSELGQKDAAIACYRKILTLDPTVANASSNLGNLLREQGQLDEAIACYREAIELAPTVAVFHSNLGFALAVGGQSDAAVDCFTRAIALDPNLTQAYTGLGNELYRRDRLDEALVQFDTAIGIAPRDPANYIGLSGVLRRAGRVDEAIFIARKAVELDPRLIEAQLLLGALLCDHKKDYDGALACFEAAVELEPRSAPAWQHFGTALLGKKRIDEALVCFRKAAEIDAVRSWARYGIASCLLAKAAALPDDGTGSRLAEQSRLRREALDAFRDSLAGHAELLRSANSADRETVRLELAAWRRDPDLAAVRDASALAELPADERDAFTQLWIDADALARSLEPATLPAVGADERDAAQAYLEATLERQRAELGVDHPDTITTLQKLAGVHQRAGRIDQAQTLFQEALELSQARHGPDHPSTLALKNNLALTYWQEGRLDKSIPLMEEALGSFRTVSRPNHPDLLMTAANLGVGYLDAGRVNDAIPLLEEARRGMGSRPGTGWITERLFGALLQAEATTALEHWPVVIEHMRKDPGEDAQETIVAMNNYGYALARSRRFAEAEASLQETIEREVRVLGEGHMLLLQTRTNLGEMYLEQGQHARAAELLRKCLTERAEKEPDSFRLASTQSMLGRVLAQEREFAEAEPLLLAGCEGLRKHAGATPDWGRYYLPATLQWLVDLYDAWERPADAAKWREQLAETRAGPAKVR